MTRIRCVIDGVCISISRSRDGDGDWSALGSTYMALINARGALVLSLYVAQYGGKTGQSTLPIKGNWHLASLTFLQSNLYSS